MRYACVRNEVELVPLACEDEISVRNEVELVPLACEDGVPLENPPTCLQVDTETSTSLLAFDW